ncbi:MAG: LPXTG cell wall anchor domain-containing protein [Actinobacteria bacterium]|nr:LPXTG cell wall anchor domain-containing protein [Actinomycetota bacterium]
MLLGQALVWTATGTLHFSELPSLRLPATDTSYFNLALVGLNLVIALGMLLLRPWAWMAAMTVQGTSLGAGLWAYYLGSPDFLLMGTSVLVVLYLNLHEVRRPFGVEDLRLRWNAGQEEPDELL